MTHLLERNWSKFTKSQQYGSSYRQALLIRSFIDPSGLPVKNFVLARQEHMVSWNCETGEVKTIKYGNGSQISYIDT